MQGCSSADKPTCMQVLSRSARLACRRAGRQAVRPRPSPQLRFLAPLLYPAGAVDTHWSNLLTSKMMSCANCLCSPSCCAAGSPVRVKLCSTGAPALFNICYRISKSGTYLLIVTCDPAAGRLCRQRCRCPHTAAAAALHSAAAAAAAGSRPAGLPTALGQLTWWHTTPAAAAAPAQLRKQERPGGPPDAWLHPSGLLLWSQQSYGMSAAAQRVAPSPAPGSRLQCS